MGNRMKFLDAVNVAEGKCLALNIKLCVACREDMRQPIFLRTPCLCYPTCSFYPTGKVAVGENGLMLNENIGNVVAGT